MSRRDAQPVGRLRGSLPVSRRTCRGVSLSDLTRPKELHDVDATGRPGAYELPQCLGEIARELRIGAIRFPSSPASGGVNIVIFTEHLATTGGWYETTDPVTGAAERWP